MKNGLSQHRQLTDERDFGQREGGMPEEPTIIEILLSLATSAQYSSESDVSTGSKLMTGGVGWGE